MQKLLTILMAALLGSTALRATETPVEPAAVATMPGLKAGDAAPDFTLKSSTGATVSLEQLREPNGVTLVFVRSAEWCPYCRRQLQDLEANRAEIEAAGTRLVGVSYDSAETLAQAAAKLGVTYPLLSDAGSTVIDAFGIRNAEAKGRAEGIPHPAIFVIDAAGIIRSKLMEAGYKDRPAAEVVLQAVRTSRGEG